MPISEITDPTNAVEVIEFSRQVSELLNARLSFGDPVHPEGVTSFPNGRPENIRGTFAVVEFTATNTATSVAHNLGQPIVGTTTVNPNVMWHVLGLRHNGTGVGGGTEPMSIEFREGDVIGTDAIELRAMAAGARTVSAPNPITACLFFEPSTPW